MSCRFFRFPTATVALWKILYSPTPTKSLGILCGKKSLLQKRRSKGTEPVVMGERNLSRSSKRSRRSSPKASHNDQGRVLSQARGRNRSEEHTSELQSLAYLVCRLLLEKKKKK